MKRTISLLLLACMACLVGHAQYTVKPSEAVGDARLGMPITDIMQIIGKASSTVSYEMEKQAWESFGYKLPDKLVFGIAFDKVYIFDNPNSLAIWKIYTYNDTAVIFNLSSYVHGKETTKGIGTNQGITFYNDSLAVKNSMGNDFEKKVDEGHNTLFLYTKKGIEFIVNENEVRNMFIFRAFEREPKKKEPCIDEGNRDLPIVKNLPLLIPTSTYFVICKKAISSSCRDCVCT